MNNGYLTRAVVANRSTRTIVNKSTELRDKIGELNIHQNYLGTLLCGPLKSEM